MAITQSNMLNEVTILPANLPTIILKKRANEWQFEKLFDGSTEQVELSNKANLQLIKKGEDEETKLWYAGNDLYQNNYLFNINYGNLPQMPALLTANYTAYQLPNLLGSIKTVQVVDEDKLVDLAKNISNDDDDEDEDGFDEGNEDGNSKVNLSSLDVEVYPNPVFSYFQIKNLSSNDLKAIYLYNLKGKLLKFSNNTSIAVDVNGIKPGVYIVKVKTVDHLLTKKLVIQ